MEEEGEAFSFCIHSDGREHFPEKRKQSGETWKCKKAQNVTRGNQNEEKLQSNHDVTSGNTNDGTRLFHEQTRDHAKEGKGSKHTRKTVLMKEVPIQALDSEVSPVRCL